MKPDLTYDRRENGEHVKAIAGSHPAFPSEITPAQYKSCRAFLRNFSRIYTFNYDLLLYWTTMHNDVDGKNMHADDGFRTPPDNPKAEYVTWEAYNSATVQYLHGALHLFDAGAELRKYTWTRTGIPLMDQIKSALEQGLFPLYVSEGTSESKADRIVHHGYLHRALRSFEGISGSLYIYGHSLDKNDNHVLRILTRPECKIENVFVSIHGDQSKPSNQNIIKEARAIETVRAQAKRKLNVYFFDSDSAQVWTAPDPDAEKSAPKTKT